MVALEFLFLFLAISISVWVVSSFILRHSKKNDKLRKKVGTLFLEDNNNTKTKEN